MQTVQLGGVAIWLFMESRENNDVSSDVFDELYYLENGKMTFKAAVDFLKSTDFKAVIEFLKSTNFNEYINIDNNQIKNVQDGTENNDVANIKHLNESENDITNYVNAVKHN